METEMNHLKDYDRSPKYSAVEKTLLVLTALASGALIAIFAHIAYHKGMQGFEDARKEMHEMRWGR